MRELFPKQKTKFVDAVKGADRAVFGGVDASPDSTSRHETTGSSSQENESDLDHEQDDNILGRLERELKRLEVLEKEEEEKKKVESKPFASPSS